MSAVERTRTLQFPQIESAAKLGVTADTKAYLYKLFDNQIDNYQICSHNGFTFPVTTINVTHVARELLAQNHGKVSANKVSHEHKEKSPVEHKFLFAGAATAGEGYPPYHAAEQALAWGMDALPEVLDALREGREPKDIYIHTLGSVATRWTALDRQRARAIKTGGHHDVAPSYGAYVQSVLSASTGRDTEVTFHGWSISAHTANATAEYMKSLGLVTQDLPGEESVSDLPKLHVENHRAVGYHDSRWQGRVQIPIGFLTEIADQSMHNAVAFEPAMQMGKFAKALELELGLEPKLSPAQRWRKRKARVALRRVIFKGQNPTDLGVHVQVHQGEYDPLTFTPGQALHVAKNIRRVYRGGLSVVVGDDEAFKAESRAHTEAIWRSAPAVMHHENTSHMIPFLAPENIDTFNSNGQKVTQILTA